jgi:N-carbamoyl-L-amino-acid hydrolase
MTVDLRHVDDATLDRLEAAFSARTADLAAEHGVAAHLERTVVSPRVKFHSTLVRAVADAVERCGYSHREIVSGAGHDACNVARKIPTAMIFIPCKDGISHNEEESATHVDCEAGCNVLLHAVLSLANSSDALPHGEG